MKRRRQSFKSYLQDSLDYNETPLKPEDADLDFWVSRLREGDFTYRQQIITSHMRLAMSIVTGFATQQRSDDLVGEAFLGLTQAVEWAGPHISAEGTSEPSRLNDNNITPYIASTIRRFLRDFIEKDRTVYMPGRTFRHKVADGLVDRDGDNMEPVLVAVVSLRVLVLSDETGDVHSSHNVPFSIPEAKREEPSVEFTEALTLAIRTEDEREVINLRSQGYKYREIAEKMGFSQSHVGDLNTGVEKRFNRLYA